MNTLEGRPELSPSRRWFRAVSPVQTDFAQHLLDTVGEEWIEEGQDRIPALLQMLSVVRQRVAIVACGDLVSGLFGHQQVLQSLEGVLARGASVELAFYERRAASAEEAEARIRRDAQSVVRLIEKFPPFCLLWSPRYPRLHLVIVDGEHTMNEVPDHADDGDPRTMFKQHKGWARDREGQFQQVRKASQEIFNNRSSI